MILEALESGALVNLVIVAGLVLALIAVLIWRSGAYKRGPIFWLKTIAVVAIGTVTVGLAGLNTYGAWHASFNWWYTACILGVEMFVAVTLPLLLSSPDWRRMAAGALVFGLQVYVCIENGVIGVKTAQADIFTADPDVLRQQAELRLLEAQQAEELAAEYRADRTTERQSATDLYGQSVVTATSAVRDEAIRLEQQAADQRAIAMAARQEIIQLEASADRIEEKERWLIIILSCLEGTRSLGLWAFVLWANKEEDEHAEAKAALDEKRRRAESLKRTNEKKKREEFIKSRGITDVGAAMEFMDRVERSLDSGKSGDALMRAVGFDNWVEFASRVNRYFANEDDKKLILGDRYASG